MSDQQSCCAPGRTGGSTAVAAPVVDHVAEVRHDMVDLAGGTFVMGTSEQTRFRSDGEGPAREVDVEPFSISAHTVSNRQFADFIEATDYVTEAQRFGWSFVFHLLLPDDFPDTRAVAATPWWRQVYGADWCHPHGPQSSVDDSWNHPVVQVSWNDAQAYCQWAAVRLPTEAEWEFAGRGGLVQKRYAWGDEFQPNGQTMCNIFEGTFPAENTAEDGYVGTCPVDQFPPNGFGLHNVAGNVWEWCSDWFKSDAKVIRGGSYLCHDSYCDRYRIAARSSNSPDSTTGNLGFRVARDADPAQADDTSKGRTT